MTEESSRDDTVITGYDELYANIRYWVEQQEALTNVPDSNVFDEQEDESFEYEP